MFSKKALWRRTANQIYWMLRDPRIMRIYLACIAAHLRAKYAHNPHLTEIDEAAYRASRRSDRVFVFGSGASLNDITPQEWEHIAEHNTFGFSMFVYQNFVRTDYHLLRELYITKEFDKSFWLPYSQEFVDHLDNNPHFDKTILIAQAGWHAMTVNRMLALKQLRKPRQILRFYTGERSATAPPTFSLKEGVVHSIGTMTDAVNLAVIGGWKHIILTGVDLYDGRYFWEKQHASAQDFGRDPNAVHNTVNNGIIQNIERWRDFLAPHGVKLWVYNPKSLLTSVLPVYTPDAIQDGDAR